MSDDLGVMTSGLVIRGGHWRWFTILLGAASATFGVAVAATEQQGSVGLFMLCVFGGIAAWMFRIAVTVVRVDGEQILIRNPWRTYRLHGGVSVRSGLVRSGGIPS